MPVNDPEAVPAKSNSDTAPTPNAESRNARRSRPPYVSESEPVTRIASWPPAAESMSVTSRIVVLEAASDSRPNVSVPVPAPGDSTPPARIEAAPTVPEPESAAAASTVVDPSSIPSATAIPDATVREPPPARRPARKSVAVPVFVRLPLATVPENVVATAVVIVRAAPPRSTGPVKARPPVPAASPNATSPPTVTALENDRLAVAVPVRVPPSRASTLEPNEVSVPARSVPAESRVVPL